MKNLTLQEQNARIEEKTIIQAEFLFYLTWFQIALSVYFVMKQIFHTNAARIKGKLYFSLG